MADNDTAYTFEPLTTRSRGAGSYKARGYVNYLVLHKGGDPAQTGLKYSRLAVSAGAWESWGSPGTVNLAIDKQNEVIRVTPGDAVYITGKKYKGISAMGLRSLPRGFYKYVGDGMYVSSPEETIGRADRKEKGVDNDNEKE